MNRTLTMAVDAGTGSCRAALFDADGRQVAIGQREWVHRPVPDVAGSQAFDTAANWPLVCACVREAVDSGGGPEAVAAVSATAMREGMVLWDDEGRELWACPNVDGRAGAQAERLVADGDAARIYERAGDWVAITAPARFLWLAEHEPETLRRTAHVGMLSDWVLTRLSGAFVTDPTIGASSGMFDLARRTWSPEILDICGLDPAIFPPVRDPGTVVGEVSPEAAAATGLRPGTPVVVGGADTQLGLVGIGGVEPDRITVVGGTFWQTTIVVDRPLIDPEGGRRTLCHALPGQWMTEGIGFYSGLAMRWFRDAVWRLRQGERDVDGDDPYVLMEREATGVPAGANGVVGVFSNVMDAKRWVQAAPSFLGLDVNDPDATAPACVRAIEEAAAYVARAHVEVIREIAGGRDEEVVFTGGAARGRLWPQVIADVLGLPVCVPAVTESTALGGALYARVGAGLDRRVEDAAARVVRFERRYEPDAATHARYDELYAAWREIYRRVLALSEEGLVRPLWRAAGA